MPTLPQLSSAFLLIGLLHFSVSATLTAQQAGQSLEAWEDPWPDSVRTSPSPELTSVPDSVWQRVGSQHWRFAGIGVAVGAAVGALSGALLASIDQCSDCDQWSAAHGAVVLALMEAGAGGVIGFLAGLASPKYAWAPAE